MSLVAKQTLTLVYIAIRAKAIEVCTAASYVVQMTNTCGFLISTFTLLTAAMPYNNVLPVPWLAAIAKFSSVFNNRFSMLACKRDRFSNPILFIPQIMSGCLVNI